MANILGIDYGQAVVGVALATTPLAEPLSILDNDPRLLSHLRDICTRHQVQQIVVGLSEGHMAQLTKQFALSLGQVVTLPIIFHDETLTSKEAQSRLRHAPRHVRSAPQDAFQATVMLQDYLDTHPQT